MSSIEQQVLDTWYINHAANIKLINNLTEDSLAFTTSKRGGGSIGHQLAHIYNVRYWRIERIEKSLIAGLKTVKAEDEKSKEVLIDLHELSTDLVAKLIMAGLPTGGYSKGFKHGVVPLMASFVTHEAHHRGNILLTLKLSGFKLNNDLKYGLWDWSKTTSDSDIDE